jgi:serine/threonine protein kinase
VILGTAAYMSPEQAAGRPSIGGTDLWAFGVVLFEMLTGRQLFDGESVSHVIAAVLKDDPDWSALPAGTPAVVTKLLRRCIEKDRRKRLADAATARLDVTMRWPLRRRRRPFTSHYEESDDCGLPWPASSPAS